MNIVHGGFLSLIAIIVLAILMLVVIGTVHKKVWQHRYDDKRNHNR